MLTEKHSFDQFVAFLALREIFQSVTKITIMGRFSHIKTGKNFWSILLGC
jgi:hypothetical protein